MVRRPYTPFYSSLIYRGQSTPEFFAPCIDTAYALSEVAMSEYVWYYSTEEVKKMGEITLASWMKPGKLDEVRAIFTEREAKVMSSIDGDLKAFCDAYVNYIPALNTVAFIDRPVSELLKSSLQEKISAEETEELMSELNIPLEDNFYKKEEYDLVMASDLEAHAKQYEWTTSRYGDETPYTAEQAKQRLAAIGLSREKYLKHYEEEKQKVRASVAKAKEILGDKAHIVDIMQFIIFYRTHRTDVMNRASYLNMPKMKTEAAARGLTYKQILFCLESEVLGTLPSIEIIEERIKDHSMLLENGITRCAIGAEAQKVREELAENNEAVKEFKGTIACKGLVRGRAKVFFSVADSIKVEEGDILVTSMTTPDMVPAMKKAVAFVTDEGGITCHAAIISREMKKPCIIGTKIATQVLKDGMEIEVDADKGIVKIL